MPPAMRFANDNDALPKTNIAPEKWWLGKYFPFGMAYFFKGYLSFRGHIISYTIEIPMNLACLKQNSWSIPGFSHVMLDSWR